MRKDSLYLRVFLWLWEANPERLNICKLFWGTIFAPLAFVSTKREFKIIPRVSILYFVLGFVFLAFAKPSPSFPFFFFGLVAIPLVYFHKRHSKEIAMENKRAESQGFDDEALDEFLASPTGRLIAIIIDPIARIFYFFLDIWENPRFRKSIGFFTMFAEFFRSTKNKTCVLIQVE